jgi:hypothetical protein
MHIADNLWQGNSVYWQDLFVHHHIVPIGHTAWQGFLNHGLGMVTCSVDLSPNQSINWHTDIVPYYLEFIPQQEIREYLSRLEFSLDTINYLEQNITNYNPRQEVIILISGNGQINLNRLQNLKISPVQCYQQLEARWSEFQVCTINQERRR